MSGTAIMQASPLGAPASSSPPTPHIEVDRLELYYGNVPAVRGVSFNVLAGEQQTPLWAPRGRNPHRRGPGLFVRTRHPHTRRETRPVDGIPILCDLAAHDRIRERSL